MKKILMALVLSMCLIFTACNSKDKPKDEDKKSEITDEKDMANEDTESKEELVLDDAKKEELKAKFEEINKALEARDKEAFLKISTENIKNALGDKELDIFDNIEVDLGKFKEVDLASLDFKVEGTYYLVDTELLFENGKLVETIAFDGHLMSDGLNFSHVYKFVEPEEYEEKVMIDDGEGYPVEAILSKPEGESSAAVLLIDGTGPGDMDFTVGENKFFKKLSDELREEGVTVLRFNKRTYQYARRLQKEGRAFDTTLDEEFVKDAVQGIKDLKEKYAVDKEVFILGHSIAGAILPHINHESGDLADGYIAVSASPDKLWEIQEAQLRKIMSQSEGFDEKAKENIEQNIKNNIELVNKLEDLSDEELKMQQNFPFGIPATYLRDLNRLDTKNLYTEDNKAVLVINGENDAELKKDTSKLWEEILENKENATIKELKETNHLMQASKGEVQVTNIAGSEYAQNSPFVDGFISAIKEFIDNRLLSSSN